MQFQLRQFTASALLIAAFVTGVTVNSKVMAGDVEMGGLLMNKTITWFGQDFFYYFAREWRNKRAAKRHSLIVEEKPSARSGTQVIISYKGQVVFRTSISNTRSLSREYGVQAVPVVIEQLKDIEFQTALASHQDLLGEEL